MTKLLPCPFCGGEASLESHYDIHDPFVSCDTCDATTGLQDTDERAIEVWNRRAASPEVQARIKGLEAENSKLTKSMCSVIEAITAHLPPHGISAKKCLSRIIAAIDNPEINAVLLKQSPPAPVNGESEELRDALKGALGWVQHWQADVAGNLKPTMESLLIAEQALNAALSKREGE